MNEYFLPGSVPATNAPGSSAAIRGEFASVAAAFDKLPVLAGNASELVIINPSGTALITSGLIATDLVTLTGVQSLTNKTLSWAGNTWVGFGTAATKDAGTGPGQVLLLTEDNKLPTMNGFNLTNLNAEALGVVPVSHGGTGVSTLDAAKTALGVDLKADANNAVLTGAPVCPTPADGDNSAKLANTFFVNQAIAGVGGLTPSNTTPLMDGVGSAGTAVQASRADHIHPSDTSRAPLNSPAFTGNPTAPTPTAGDNDTSIATTAFVTAAVAAGGGVSLSSANPIMDGVAAPGVGTTAARGDHVHPTDTSRAPTSAGTAAGTSFTPAGAIAATDVQAALVELDTEKAPLASPAFTGNPTAPTPATVDNDTSIATTAFVQAVVAAQPAGMSPSNDVPLINGVAAAGTSVTGSRSDHVHPTDTSRAAAATLTAHTGDTANPHSVTKSQVGLGSVDNTSDTTKNASVATLTNKTLDAANCKLGAITGLLKAVAGAFSAATAGTDYIAPGGPLGTPSSGNLVNCAFPTFNQNTTGSAASVSGTTTAAIAASALGTGTADATTYLRGDRTWATVAAGVTSFNGRTGAIALTNNDILDTHTFSIGSNLPQNGGSRSGNTMSNTAMVEIINWRVRANGTFRVTYTLARTGTAWNVWAQVYKNGVAYGTKQTTSSTSPVGFTEDVTLSIGDTLQMFAAGYAGTAGADVVVTQIGGDIAATLSLFDPFVSATIGER